MHTVQFEDNDSLLRRLEHINSWISNCDQKASIMLALLGVVVPLFVASDFVIGKLGVLIGLIKLYFQQNEGGFCLYNAFCLTAFVLSLMFASLAVSYLLQVLKGNIDYKKFRGEGVESDSLFFFGNITTKSYTDYKSVMTNEEYNSMNDLLSQIYVNSNICNNKYVNYNKALRYVCCFLCSFAATFILFLFV